jgi:hypothetical protein
VNSKPDYITIPEAADLYKSMLNYNSKNKYDSIYRSILEKAKSGMFSPTSLHNRTLLINKQEFCNYVKGLTSNQYEQLKFNIDDEDIINPNTKDCTLPLEELLTLIKLHRKLEIPPEETLRCIEKLVSLNLGLRGD